MNRVCCCTVLFWTVLFCTVRYQRRSETEKLSLECSAGDASSIVLYFASCLPFHWCWYLWTTFWWIDERDSHIFVRKRVWKRYYVCQTIGHEWSQIKRKQNIWNSYRTQTLQTSPSPQSDLWDNVSIEDGSMPFHDFTLPKRKSFHIFQGKCLFLYLIP